MQRRITVHRRHDNLVTQRCLGDINLQVENNVVATALEELVRGHVEDDKQIACRPAVQAGATFAGQANLRIAVHARRNLDLLRDRAINLLAAVACPGRRGESARRCHCKSYRWQH